MSADWTTFRVVRDRDGDLWGHDDVGWRLLGEESFLLRLLSTEALATLGPIVPVLDADAQPVVQHLWNPMTDQTWCGGGERTTESMAEARPRVPVCAYCHIKAMHWRAGHPMVTTVGDLTARHIGKRVRVETDRTLPHRVRLLREIATASNKATRLTLEVINHPEWFLMAHFTLDTPCEVLP